MHRLPLLIFIGLVLVFAQMLLHQARPVDAGSVSDAPFPAITVTSLDGKKNWDGMLFKNRVTLVNFYASWCAPCAAEMPELVALKKKFAHLQIVGIAWNDDPTRLKQWLAKNGNPFHSQWFDENGDATIALGIKGIPESLIVDADGMVRYRVSGPINPALREGELDALLTQLEADTQTQREVNHGL